MLAPSAAPLRKECHCCCWLAAQLCSRRAFTFSLTEHSLYTSQHSHQSGIGSTGRQVCRRSSARCGTGMSRTRSSNGAAAHLLGEGHACNAVSALHCWQSPRAGQSQGLGGGHSDRMSRRRHVHVLQSIYCVVMSAAGLKQQMSLLPCNQHILHQTLRCFLRSSLPIQYTCSRAVACNRQASGQGRSMSS